jgi:CheY-like chemotaxis protein
MTLGVANMRPAMPIVTAVSASCQPICFRFGLCVAVTPVEDDLRYTAIQTAVTENPNLIFLDLRFPDMDGIDVGRALHKFLTTGHIPVVGWTIDPISIVHAKIARSRIH